MTSHSGKKEPRTRDPEVRRDPAGQISPESLRDPESQRDLAGRSDPAGQRSPDTQRDLAGRSDRGGSAGLLEVGVVIKPHGVRGSVKVRLHNGQSTALQRAAEALLILPGVERRLALRLLGVTGEGVILELEGVRDREGAERLRGARLLVDREVLEPLAEGEVFCDDLIGCRVQDENGASLGTVDQVFSAGGAEVLVVVDGRLERMIPFAEGWILEVALEERIIRVTGAEQLEPYER